MIEQATIQRGDCICVCEANQVDMGWGCKKVDRVWHERSHRGKMPRSASFATNFFILFISLLENQ